MKIAPEIERDSIFIKDLELSQLRLFKDGDLDWFLLIPRVEGAKDWSDLELKEQEVLCKEITEISNYLKAEVGPDKINVASLGNMVPQLHIHIIARYKSDRAWPAPIWGTESSSEFKLERLDFWISKLK